MAKKTTDLKINPRTKKTPKYRSFRLNQRIAPTYIKTLPGVWQLWRETWVFIWQHRYKMLGFGLIYALAYVTFVKGVAGFDTDGDILKEEFQNVIGGNIGAIFSFVALYTTYLSSLAVVEGEIANYYQFTIMTIFSLSFIWLLRKLSVRGSKATLKDAFYRGMGPAIPFLGVILIMAGELIPGGLGSLLMATADSSTVASNQSMLLLAGAGMVLTVVLSLYLLAGSIFAIYIVTLPGTGPMQAVKASMNLLRIHRWRVLLKIIGFVILLIVAGFIIVLPFIIWLPRWSEVALFVLSCLSFAVFHTYLYKLYRSMIK